MKNRNKAIVKSDTISDVIERYPYTTEVFLEYGLHCVGCFANVFDTIESGCTIHGMNKKQIDSLLLELNKVINLNS